MKITIRHQLSLDLGPGVPRALQHLLLTPQTSSVQTVREWRIEVEGLDDPGGFLDAYGNRAHLASQTKPEPELGISVSGTVETHDRNGVVGRLAAEPVQALFRRVTPLTKPMGAVVTKFRSAPRTGSETTTTDGDSATTKTAESVHRCSPVAGSMPTSIA